MMRIADLLNNSACEDEEKLLDERQLEAASTALVRLGRSVSAPVRGRKASVGADDAAMIDEDEHSVSCPEDKQSPCYVSTNQSASRFGSYSRKQAKTSMKRSPRSLSPSAISQQRAMTIQNIVNPDESMGENGDVAWLGQATAPTKSGKKRSTRSLFPSTSDTDRRAKQRLIVKRCYYKKINTIKALRSEASSLEQQFRRALHARQQEDAEARAAGRGDDHDVKLRELFMDTLETKETLREENTRLRRLADEYFMKNQGRLRQLLDSRQKGLILFTAVSQD